MQAKIEEIRQLTLGVVVPDKQRQAITAGTSAVVAVTTEDYVDSLNGRPINYPTTAPGLTFVDD